MQFHDDTPGLVGYGGGAPTKASRMAILAHDGHWHGTIRWNREIVRPQHDPIVLFLVIFRFWWWFGWRGWPIFIDWFWDGAVAKRIWILVKSPVSCRGCDAEIWFVSFFNRLQRTACRWVNHQWVRVASHLVWLWWWPICAGQYFQNLFGIGVRWRAGSWFALEHRRIHCLHIHAWASLFEMWERQREKLIYSWTNDFCLSSSNYDDGYYLAGDEDDDGDSSTHLGAVVLYSGWGHARVSKIHKISSSESFEIERWFGIFSSLLSIFHGHFCSLGTHFVGDLHIYHPIRS